MTALFFYLGPEQVCLAMDTQCHLPYAPEEAWNFCTKMVVLPHLHGVICGRGVRDVIYEFSELVQSHALVRDVIELDAFAVEHLPDIAERCGVTQEITSSIYCFGLSRELNEFVGYKYSSKVGFTSEVLENGWRAMPCYDEDSFLELGTGNTNLPADFVSMMVAAKEHDDALPETERAIIGGEIQYLWMTPTVLQVSTCHEFPDFKGKLRAARAREAAEDDEL